MYDVDRDYLKDCIADDGLHYTMMHSVSFGEIEDATFQKLLADYRAAAAALAEYLGVDA